ncbi:hypothetical protein pb186bvf_005628 [Paramecium bursaria]
MDLSQFKSVSHSISPTKAPFTPVETFHLPQTDFSPSPIKGKRPSQIVSASLNQYNVSRKLSNESEYRRFKVQSPQRQSQNSLPPKGPIFEVTRIVNSPIKYQVPKSHLMSFTPQKQPNIIILNSHPLQIKTILQNVQFTQAETLKTDMISEQSVIGSNANRSQDELKSFRNQNSKKKDKENQISFKQIKFNRQKTQETASTYTERMPRLTNNQLTQKSEYESQPKSLHNNKNDDECKYDQSQQEMTQKFDSLCQKTDDQNEIQLLQQYCSQKDQEINNYKQQCQTLELSLKAANQQIAELENLLDYFKQDNEKYRTQERSNSQQKIQSKEYAKIQNLEQLDTIRQLKQQIYESQQKVQENHLLLVQVRSYKNQQYENEQKIKRLAVDKEQLKIENNNLLNDLQNTRNQVQNVKELELMIEQCQNDQDGFIKSLENKESEITFLKSRISKYSDTDQKLRNEINKLTGQLQNLQNEKQTLEQKIQNFIQMELDYESLKNDVDVLESQKKLLMDEYESLVQQSQRINQMNETLKQQYQSQQKENYEYQIKYNDAHIEKDKLLQQDQNNQQQIQQLCVEIDIYKREMENCQAENEELCNKMQQMQIVHQQQFQELQQQLDEWFKKQIELEIQKVMEPILSEKYYFEESLKQSLQNIKQLEEQNQKLLDECEHLYNQKEGLVTQLQQYEQTMDHVSSQQEYHSKFRKDLEQELKEMTKLNEELIRDKQSTQVKIECIQSQYDEINEILLRQNAEKLTYENLIFQLKDRISKIELENEQLQNQNQLLSQQLSDKSDIFAQNKDQIEEAIYSMSEELENIKKELQKRKDELQERETDLIRANSSLQSSDLMIKQLQETNNNLNNELNQLYNLIKKRKEEQENLQIKLDAKTKEIHTKQKEQIDIQIQLKQFQDKVSYLQKDKDDLIKSIEELRKQNDKYSIEMGVKNKELIALIEELNNLKIKQEENQQK